MQDIVLREHIAPETEADPSTSLNDINRPDFDLKSHFSSDILVEVGGWLVVKKTKSWGLLDAMVVDAGSEVRSSFDQFSRQEINDLFSICIEGVEALKKTGAAKIFVGANINHGFKDREDTFLRLHLHILGLKDSDFAKMGEVKLSDLIKKHDRAKDLIVDPMLADFSTQLIGDLSDILSGGKKYQFGLRFDLDDLESGNLAEAIGKIDAKIAQKFPSLSYSFCIVIDGDKTHLNISPRSVFGKGVLESEGILLRRNKDMKFTSAQIDERDKFFGDFIARLTKKFSNINKGKYLKREEK